MKRLTALTLALSLCFTLVGCGGNPSSNAPASVDKSTASSGTASTEETYVLKLGMQQGNVDRSESAEVTWVERFKEEVEANSNGRITVEIFPSAQLGSQEDNVASLANNSLEMTCVNSTILNTISPSTMMLACPALFANEEECDAVLASEWGQNFWDNVAKESGVRVLTAPRALPSVLCPAPYMRKWSRPSAPTPFPCLAVKCTLLCRTVPLTARRTPLSTS